MKLPKAWILDLDDTLYLERDYVLSGFKAVDQWLQASRDITGFADCCWEIFERGVRGRVFDQAIVELGVSADTGLVAELVAVYREHQPRITLAADAREFLQHPPGGRLVGVLTGGSLAAQRRKVLSLGLANWTDCIVYAGSWGPDYDKPHSRGWVTVQNVLGLRPEELQYVGDNPLKDFETPLALGWNVIRVRRPGSEHHEVETPHGVDEVVDLASLHARLPPS